jgi:hypothetical protein
MPARTPPDSLLAAMRNFAQREFADRHHYALALHIDEPHPHVHLFVKGMSEDWGHLNIRKPMLREWRQEFARLLRAQGVPVKATPRSLRRKTRPSKLKGIYRPVKGRRTALLRR